MVIYMSRAYVSSILDAPVSRVWSVLGDFHSLARWVAMIATSEPEGGEGIGSVRRVTLVDGRVVGERLVAYDGPHRSYAYEFDDAQAPFPVGSYRGTVHVLPVTDSERTFVEWYGDFDCEADAVDLLRETFTGIYSEFIADLRKHLSTPS
ncbi:SRPBCC family protein [Nocardia sp. NPDC004568]|uniref:SRPBCC family protein n=1 Tax=Nocardia sp. NPDC004568 TaxID=3154551 RepID=UPI0033B219EB